MGRDTKAHATEDIWHLGIEDLLSPLEAKSVAAGPGPFVINLRTSTAPIGNPPGNFPKFDQLHLYQLTTRTSGRPQFRLRLGIIESELQADTILSQVRDFYPAATKECIEDADRAQVPQQTPAPKPVEQPAAQVTAPPPPAAPKPPAPVSRPAPPKPPASVSRPAPPRPPASVSRPTAPANPAPPSRPTMPSRAAAPRPAPPPAPPAAKPVDDSFKWNIDELLPDLAMPPIARAKARAGGAAASPPRRTPPTPPPAASSAAPAPRITTPAPPARKPPPGSQPAATRAPQVPPAPPPAGRILPAAPVSQTPPAPRPLAAALTTPVAAPVAAPVAKPRVRARSDIDEVDSNAVTDQYQIPATIAEPEPEYTFEAPIPELRTPIVQPAADPFASDASIEVECIDIDAASPLTTATEPTVAQTEPAEAVVPPMPLEAPPPMSVSVPVPVPVPAELPPPVEASVPLIEAKIIEEAVIEVVVPPPQLPIPRPELEVVEIAEPVEVVQSAAAVMPAVVPEAAVEEPVPQIPTLQSVEPPAPPAAIIQADASEGPENIPVAVAEDGSDILTIETVSLEALRVQDVSVRASGIEVVEVEEVRIEARASLAAATAPTPAFPTPASASPPPPATAPAPAATPAPSTPSPQPSVELAAPARPSELKPATTEPKAEFRAPPAPASPRLPPRPAAPSLKHRHAPSQPLPPRPARPQPPAARVPAPARAPSTPAQPSNSDTGSLESLVARIGALVETAEAADPTGLVAAAAARNRSAAPAKAAPVPHVERTQTLHALTPLDVDESEASRWFAIQLILADTPIDAAEVPSLDIFDQYRLYSVTGFDGERIMHALRLGFFSSESAAQAVAGYLGTFFKDPSIKRVRMAEQERFEERRVHARKDIGATGCHAIIELEAPAPLPERRPDIPPPKEVTETPAAESSSILSRLLSPRRR